MSSRRRARNLRQPAPSPPKTPAAGPSVAKRAILWAVCCGAIYLTIAGQFRVRYEQTDFAHHILLADAMLHGHVHARDSVLAARLERVIQENRVAIARRYSQRGVTIPPDRIDALAIPYARRACEHDWTIVNGEYYGYWGPMTA